MYFHDLKGVDGMKVRYNGFIDALRKISSQEGFFALYKGLGPVASGIAPKVIFIELSI
jgi:hypothetical protein